MFTLNIRLVKKCNCGDFNYCMIVGASWSRLSISKTDKLLGIHAQATVYTEWWDGGQEKFELWMKYLVEKRT